MDPTVELTIVLPRFRPILSPTIPQHHSTRLDEPFNRQPTSETPGGMILGTSPTSTRFLRTSPSPPTHPPSPPPPQLSINKIDTGVPKLFVSHLGSPGPHSARYRLVQDRRKPDTVVQSKGRISESASASVLTIGSSEP